MTKHLKSNVRESQVAKYLLANLNHYGFLAFAYNKGNGFDFILITQSGKIISTELETNWEHYFEHRHHRDPRFAPVQLLIIHSPADPPTNKLHFLPPSILHIGLAHYQEYHKQEPERLLQNIKHMREKGFSCKEIAICLEVPLYKLRNIIHSNHIQKGTFNFQQYTQPKHEMVQVQSPKTKHWMLIDKTEGIIIKHSRTCKPYKNVTIIGKSPTEQL